MLAWMIAVPVLGFLMMVQSAVVSRVTLLQGTADLLLLALVAWSLQPRVKTAWHWSVIAGAWFALMSALPFAAVPVGYLATTGLGLVLRKRVWEVPVLAMFITVFGGTLFTQGLSIVAVLASGTRFPILEALELITLPSLLLNLILSLPVYALMSDLASWLYPQEIDL